MKYKQQLGFWGGSPINLIKVFMGWHGENIKINALDDN